MIIARLSGHGIGTKEFEYIYKNEALRSAFIEIEHDNERRDYTRTKAMVESMQMLYNIIDQYATLDLARSGFTRYKTFENKTLGQKIKQAMSKENQREVAMRNARDLANIFNSKHGTI